MKVTFKGDWDETVSYEDSPEMHKKVFDHLIENYFKKHGSYCGESIMQSDDPQIYAPELLSEIADDIIKFEVDYGDE